MAAGYFFFRPGIRTLKRTVGRLVFEISRVWLFRRRRSSLASRDQKLVPAHTATATRPMSQNSHSCLNTHLFYRPAPFTVKREPAKPARAVAFVSQASPRLAHNDVSYSRSVPFSPQKRGRIRICAQGEGLVFWNLRNTIFI